MSPRFFSPVGRVVAASVVATIATAPAADAASRDKRFFQQVAGVWKGPGEIVAGKYKGTKFTCNLTGQPAEGKETGMTLDGTCRVGVFSQPMRAVIAQVDGNYKGEFLDGADGKGLDIVSGQVNGDRVVMGINRAKLNGAMVARIEKDTAMNITISVKVEDRMIPVIGLKLNRQASAMAVAEE
ncbi:hypothetical protein J5N58_00760 [Rhizobium cremeum]|uniref:hypothetical protein n=1 Tax=Rhizobium cremeum TaxID=2813827 RepID=UPI000DD8AD9B|nr:hypothetical protein [Rhizobium cremeum]MCJ7993126.1 hypothetical protein [Rhizobium cremeum]MCJ7998191.1 hypothetical protein [Rhizobium cremeum]